jgi:hypothetical protein
MKQISFSPCTKEEGLREFQRRGWVLVDATYEPVKLGTVGFNQGECLSAIETKAGAGRIRRVEPRSHNSLPLAASLPAAKGTKNPRRGVGVKRISACRIINRQDQVPVGRCW